MSIARPLLGALLVSASVVSVPAQQTFRSTSAIVEVDAVVTDKKGAAVRGLTKDDFIVTEDGVPQPITQFSFVDLAPPADPKDPPDPPMTAVATNQAPDGRMYVLVLDSFHVEAQRSTLVRDLAQKFVDDYVGPNDVAAVVVLGRGSVNQQFTSSKELLSAAIAPFIGQKTRSAALSLTADQLMAHATGGGKSDEVTPEDTEMGARAIEARIAYQAMQQVCEAMGPIQGRRRSLVLFSEGSDFDTSDLLGEDQRAGAGGQNLKHESSKYASDVLLAQQDMLIAARRANVAIYAIDPRGNNADEDDFMTKEVGRPASQPRDLRNGSMTMQSATARSGGTLRTFAADTGGLAVVATSNMSKGFANIVQANSTYYVIGYAPSNAANDGKYRKISVSLKPRDLNVTARQGYFAAEASKPDPKSTAASNPAAAVSPAAPASPAPNAATPRMRELLASPLPVPGLGLRVTGGPVRTQGGKTVIGIVAEIDTKDLKFAEQGGQLANDIELAFAAISAQGEIIGGQRTMGNLRLPVTDRGALTHGLRYVAEFPASAGPFQVRVAVSESAGGTAGSALLDVDAPEYAKTPITLGATLLTSASAGSLPTTGTFPMIKASLPTPPTAARSFSAREPVVALVNALGSAVKSGVDVTISVQTMDGREVSTASAKSTSAQLSADRYSAAIPVTLSNLAPGNYMLMVTARAASGKPVTSSVKLLIVP